MLRDGAHPKGNELRRVRQGRGTARRSAPDGLEGRNQSFAGRWATRRASMTMAGGVTVMPLIVVVPGS